MDEYDQGWDPEVKQYFRKIMNSFAVGLLWLLTVTTAGLFFRLALFTDSVHWYNLVFYAMFIVSLSFLILYFFRVWRKKP